ncbi:toxin glutamine deamidase domain-containing protein [Microbispora amethystogenes]|uniref:toxin glutamine deamidase domain-containing protein n=1 Tax=Microbispora amethystogenes TaxID=1427754 RepID=UPI0033D2819F
MNQEKARRHARWRLPSGVYNPVVAADGRRWRDYEQAAEAPAPSLGDRRLEVRIAALPLGVEAGAVPVVPAARNGDNAGHGMSMTLGRRGGPPVIRDAVPATAPAEETGIAEDKGDPQAAVTTEAINEETIEAITGETAEAAAGGTAASAVPDGPAPGAEHTGGLPPMDDDQDACGETALPDAEDALPYAEDSEANQGEEDGGAAPAVPGDYPSAGVSGSPHGPVDGGATARMLDGSTTDTGDGERPVPGETDAVASAGYGWPDEAVPEADHFRHSGETAESRQDEAPGDDPEAGARTASEAAPESGAVTGPETGGGAGLRADAGVAPEATPEVSAAAVAEARRDMGYEMGQSAGTGEFADGDDFWSAVLRDETERDWLDGPDRPRRLEETRTYGRPGGLAEADQEGQASLAQAVNGRFPDPRGTWIRLINAEGPTEDAFRSNNAVDCALSVMSTWHGEPVVAARRHPEYDPSGRPLLTGETGGVARAEAWLGHRFEYVGHGRRAYVAVAQRLIFGGHGAAAVLITRWAGGGSHAWNAVNCRGEVLWIDAQRGHMAVDPPYEDVTGVFAVVVDRQGRGL